LFARQGGSSQRAVITRFVQHAYNLHEGLVSRLIALALVVTFLSIPAAQERPLPDFASFAAEVKKKLAFDEERQSGYMFTERRTEQKLDGSGRTTSESVKVFEVYPGLPGQDRYRRLIEADGKRIPPQKLAEGDRDRRRDVEAYAKKMADASDRRKEEQQLDKARSRYSAAIDDLFRIYDIQMVRREPIEGHDTIFATLTPKPTVKPQTKDGDIMRSRGRPAHACCSSDGCAFAASRTSQAIANSPSIPRRRTRRRPRERGAAPRRVTVIRGRCTEQSLRGAH
jgi:hypothetical protein